MYRKLRCSNPDGCTRFDNERPLFSVTVSLGNAREPADNLNKIEASYFTCDYCNSPAEDPPPPGATMTKNEKKLAIMAGLGFEPTTSRNRVACKTCGKHLLWFHFARKHRENCPMPYTFTENNHG